ncbi:MAG: hypothetical protein COB02_01685 [Candidatus Cloacimonadota bacterium]|nr:MAG: hypothetical protein COB02_01685 [Candidatus Cloacimonadota bacterium]
MKQTSIIRKLNLSNTIGFWINYCFVATIAGFCFTSLDHSINKLLELQIKSHVEELIESSKLTLDLEKKLRLNILKDKGSTLLQKGRFVLTSYLEKKSTKALREYLEINYDFDDEIGLVSFFVEKGNKLTLWQFLSFEDAFSMKNEVVYDRKKKSWIDDNYEVFDPDVLKIIASDKLSIISKKYPIGNSEQNNLVDVYDCYTPIYNEDESTLSELKKSKKRIGYLRYIITHEQLKLLTKKENKKLLENIKTFKLDGETRISKIKILVNKVKWESLFILVFFGGIFSAARGYYLSRYIKREILTPVINLSSSLVRVSKGDLSVVIEDMDRKDEIGLMSQSMDKLIQTIRLAVTEFDQQVNHIEIGKFSYRGNIEKFEGSYVDLISGGNRLIESFISHLNVIQNMIVIINDEGQILFANKQVRLVTQKKIETVLADNIFLLFEWNIRKDELLNKEVFKKERKISLDCKISIEEKTYEIVVTAVQIKPNIGTYLLVLVDQTEIKKAEFEMKEAFILAQEASIEKSKAQTQLVEAARLAGKADIASSVLHNVGNVLNSINVSVSILKDKVYESSCNRLHQALDLIEQNKKDLNFYLNEDDKGKVLLNYLRQLAAVLVADNKKLQEETLLIEKNIGHIREIVNVQQRHTKSIYGVLENFLLEDIFDDAFSIGFDVDESSKIDLINKIQGSVTLSLDRHLLLQIIVNLLKNAKFSVEESKIEKPIIEISSRLIGNKVEICIKDNGLGIKSASLLKVFSYGFTTKKEGHGFGLHSSANAASEMGGELYAKSKGVGYGAEFYLVLPIVNEGIKSE